MDALRIVNLGVKFLLELAAFAAFAVWGASVGHGGVSVVVAVTAPLLAIALWGRLAAPKSERRLALRPRLAFEGAVFGLAVLALLAAGHPGAALVFGVIAVVNAVLLAALGQLEA